MLPQLAAEGVIGDISYPKIVSPKYNGIRGVVVDSKGYARSLKPIKNLYIRTCLSHPELNGMDGELVVPDLTGRCSDYPDREPEVFVRTVGGVMTIINQPMFKFFVFDLHNLPKMSFANRLVILQDRVAELKDRFPFLEFVSHEQVNSDEELEKLTNEHLADGMEGSVIRCPNAEYWHGRSSEAQQYFLRLVPWQTSEGRILEVIEGQSNGNPAQINELGNSARPAKKAGLMMTGRAGAVRMIDIHGRFKLPHQCTIGLRKMQHEMWANKEILVGTVHRYRYKAPVAGGPRFPQYDGPRDETDL